jgi:hypothetical protein
VTLTKKKNRYCFLLLLLFSALSLHLISPLLTVCFIGKVKADQQRVVASDKAEGHYGIMRLTKDQYKRLADPEDNEIRVKGIMYDIVSMEISGDSIICTVLKDEKETFLIAKLTNLVQSESKSKTLKRAPLWWPLCTFHSVAADEPPRFIFGTSFVTLPENDEILYGHRLLIKRPPRGTAC